MVDVSLSLIYFFLRLLTSFCFCCIIMEYVAQRTCLVYKGNHSSADDT